MNDRELLDLIEGTPWIATLLGRFDFDLYRRDYGPVEPVTLASGEPLEMIAGDGGGGAFLLAGSGPQRPMVYVGSEGEGGLVATRLRDGLALIIGVSSLHDATAFPVDEDGGRKLRDWLATADAEIRKDWPELDTARTQLRTALNLRQVDDALLRSLHEAAADLRYRPFNEEGLPYRSMLGWVEEPSWHGPDRPTTVPTTVPAGADEQLPGQTSLF